MTIALERRVTIVEQDLKDTKKATVSVGDDLQEIRKFLAGRIDDNTAALRDNQSVMDGVKRATDRQALSNKDMHDEFALLKGTIQGMGALTERTALAVQAMADILVGKSVIELLAEQKVKEGRDEHTSIVDEVEAQGKAVEAQGKKIADLGENVSKLGQWANKNKIWLGVSALLIKEIVSEVLPRIGH